ncbi:TolA-binding protein [Catalinimonas alkaloidigena]|uniref:TolA-binding protein n=1 Tax=Catalinimonas alkaloidigena TaxID=1075417 RepID=A0A1G9S3A7_9BACT|nr:tetratricopeptide repeat protein [Catalinimonas alkaloidigena]SDM29901.1 TolA-binding protein [Catalinimonas alkaloidigena]
MNIRHAAVVAGLLLSLPNDGFGQRTLGETSDYAQFQNALDLLEKEKYGAARNAFQQYLDLKRNDLQSVEAEYYLAMAAMNLYHADAESKFASFIEKYPNHPKAQLAYYELGNFYYDQRKYNKAVEYYEKASQANLSENQRYEALFRLGYAHFAQKNFTEAGKAFDQVKNTKYEKAPAASYYSGYVHLQAGNYDQALQDLRKAESDGEYQALVPAMITHIYYQQQQYDKVIDYGEAALKRGRINDADAVALLVAEAYYRKGDYAAAASRFNDYAKENRSIDAAVRYRIGYSNFMTGNNDEAIAQFKTLAAKDDTLAQNAAYHLGIAYLKTDNKQFAMTAFDQARRASYDDQVRANALFNYGKVSYDLGRYADAIAAFQEFVKQYPKNASLSEANDLLSESYLNTDNYEEAIAHIERTAQPSPRLRKAYQQVTFYRGTQLFNDKKFLPAIDMFEKSLRFPVDQNLTMGAHYWTGETWSIGKQWDKAINSYAAVFSDSRSEHYLPARYGIGYAYYNTKEYAKALPHFRAYVEAGKAQTHYDDALVRLADCYYTTKNYAQAISTYDQAAEADASVRDYVLYQKGIVYDLMGQSNKAQASFETLTEQFPRSRYLDDAQFQKAQLAFEQGSYAAAINGFTTLIQKNSNSTLVPFAYLRRAISYSNLQKHEQAINDYKKILDAYPKHETANDALLGLQENLNAVNRGQEFTAYLNRYKQANPQSTALESVEFESAKSLYLGQNYMEAIQRLQEYMKNYPNSANLPDARYYLAESYYRAGDNKQALRFHQDVIRENRSTFTSRSLERVAELTFNAGNYPGAASYYRQLLANASNRRQESGALVGLLESYYRLQKWDSVDYFSGQIMQGNNAGIDAQNKALLYAGKSAYAQKKLDDAVDYFLQTLNSAKDENGAEAQYLMARIFFEQGKYEQSLETLYDLNKKFSQYTQWLDRGFLLIADNFIATDELYQARATLESIAENSPNPETKKAAQAKLLVVKQKEQEKQATPAEEDTTFSN